MLELIHVPIKWAPLPNDRVYKNSIGGGGGGHFSIVKILLHIQFCGGLGKWALKYFGKWHNLIRFGEHFDIILSQNEYFLHRQ